MDLIEVDILDPQPEALHQPEARSVHQAGGEPGGAVELGQDSAGLDAAEDGRQTLGGPGPHDLVIEPVQRPSEDDLVEEEQGARAWFCVEAATSLCTARCVKNAMTSGSPISRGCRLPWNKMNLFDQAT